MKTIKMWVMFSYDDNFSDKELEEFRKVIQEKPKEFIRVFLDKALKDDRCNVSVSYES